jgi:zinc transporter 1/2/3
MSDSSVNCGSGGGATTYTGLRIASVFIIWGCSTFGANFPIIAHRSSLVSLPKSVFEYASLPPPPYFPLFLTVFPPSRFAKYFGSGVIIATAFIHLLSPAIDELTSPCLGAAWQDYVSSLSQVDRFPSDEHPLSPIL